MKVLLLNQTFYPDVVSTAQHLKDLALALSREGHQVTVVASRRAYDRPSERFSSFEEWEGIQIFRVSSTGFGKTAKWRRAVDFASFIFTSTFRALTLPRHDAVIALTSPPLVSFIGALLTTLRGGNFYYWIMDLNPDEALEAGWLRKGSVTERALEKMSRFSLRRADKIIALDRFMRDRIVEKEIDPEKIEIIAPWSHDDAVRFDEAGRNRFRKAHHIEDKFVIMYSGNHSPCHPLDTLLEAAQKLSSDARFLFLFVGGGSEFVKVKQFAKEHNLENILCLPYQPFDQLAASLSAADLHVVVMGNPFVGTIHPCKIYNILHVAAPLLYIGPQSSHVSDVLEQLDDKETCGWAEHGDSDAIMEEIQRIAALDRRGDETAYEALAGTISQDKLLPRFIRILDDTADRPASALHASSRSAAAAEKHTPKEN